MLKKLKAALNRLEKEAQDRNEPVIAIVEEVADGTYRAPDGRILSKADFQRLSERAGHPILIWDLPIPSSGKLETVEGEQGSEAISPTTADSADPKTDPSR